MMLVLHTGGRNDHLVWCAKGDVREASPGALSAEETEFIKALNEVITPCHSGMSLCLPCCNFTPLVLR